MSAAKAVTSNRVLLIDGPNEPGRTTANLLASLAARLAVLPFVSGADAIGALAAGFAALGREVSKTATGANLRRAIEAGRPGANGNMLWTKLRISDWVSSMPPSPILDQLRNDLALLLAEDLETTLELMPIPPQMAGTQGSQQLESAAFVDCLLGLWAFSIELARAVESVAAPTLRTSDEIKSALPPEPESHLMR